ncbi:hypothetical protein V2605_03420 [Tenacibaculum maritimum]|uniref:hypothetical protein n=1 Tax=Tenacibaculum maritimum TaxID=107401 RepID=UPI0013311159|nr:hypothetical protein [Tenacibaculum maritimum]
MGVTVLLFFAATGYAIKLSYSNYLLVKFQKEKILELENQLVESEENTKKIIVNSQNKTNNVKKRGIEIDEKLKEDEKIIDNDSITDNDIIEFLSKHQER